MEIWVTTCLFVPLLAINKAIFNYTRKMRIFSAWQVLKFSQQQIQLIFLRQTALSGYFSTIQKPTPSPSTGCAGGLVAPKVMTKNWWLSHQFRRY